jgi:hypothetical protein
MTEGPWPSAPERSHELGTDAPRGGLARARGADRGAGADDADAGSGPEPESSAPAATDTDTDVGTRAGAEIAQVYAALPASAGEPPKRLVGWSKIELKPGESKQVSVTIEPKYLSVFDEAQDGWKLVPGSYKFMVGGSSQSLPLNASVELK